jgi:inner membrane protein
MPSLITHAFVALTAGKIGAPRDVPRRFWIFALIGSVLPDLDVLAFRFGIPYSHAFGHRGVFHSLFFALLLSLALVALFPKKMPVFSRQWIWGLMLLGIIIASHGLLDALTNGGKGIALLAPFDQTRYFFPWTPIKVAPLSVKAFFGPWGWTVLKSEWLWVWLPMLGLLLMRMTVSLVRRILHSRVSADGRG